MFNYKILEDEMDSLKNEGLLVNIRTIESPQGAWVVVNGKKVLNLCSNNYLGFANDERLKKAAMKAIEEWGVGPGAVRTIAGTFKIHEELERTLAQFKGADATIFCNRDSLQTKLRFRRSLAMRMMRLFLMS